MVIMAQKNGGTAKPPSYYVQQGFQKSPPGWNGPGVGVRDCSSLTRCLSYFS